MQKFLIAILLYLCASQGLHSSNVTHQTSVKASAAIKNYANTSLSNLEKELFETKNELEKSKKLNQELSEQLQKKIVEENVNISRLKNDNKNLFLQNKKLVEELRQVLCNSRSLYDQVCSKDENLRVYEGAYKNLSDAYILMHHENEMLSQENINLASWSTNFWNREYYLEKELLELKAYIHTIQPENYLDAPNNLSEFNLRYSQWNNNLGQ
ncbi:MAG: hypothetical protein H6731_03225 [Myxococcales bacterium]|nr:MAG: hypothetical protein H6731_03225 [Myxococcales bacterium]